MGTPEITAEEARRILGARREHVTGDGRSAPKGNVTKGQEARNPELEMRDDHRARKPEPPSGFEEALRAANATTTEPRRARRPTARRSSSAKRDVKPRKPSRASSRASRPR